MFTNTIQSEFRALDAKLFCKPLIFITDLQGVAKYISNYTSGLSQHLLLGNLLLCCIWLIVSYRLHSKWI